MESAPRSGELAERQIQELEAEIARHHVVPLMDEGEPITLADGRPGRVRRCGHCGGSLSVPDNTADIEGLREENQRLYIENTEELTVEIERLRAALERIGDMWTGIDTASMIARDALVRGQQ